MTWIVGYVGGNRRSEEEFETEEEAVTEYCRRLIESHYRRIRRHRNKDPPRRMRRPWIAPVGEDAFLLNQGIVHEVIAKKGYFIVALSTQIEGGPREYYWHDGKPFLKPGDEIIYDHEIDPFPRREGLFAIRVFD